MPNAVQAPLKYGFCDRIKAEEAGEKDRGRFDGQKQKGEHRRDRVD